MSDVFIVEQAGSRDDISEDGQCVVLGDRAINFDEILQRSRSVELVRFTALHEDVDVVAGFGEVDEVDDIEVLDLLADDNF